MTPSDIIDLACSRLRIKRHSLLSTDRSYRMARFRWLVGKLIRFSGYDVREAAKALGHKDHRSFADGIRIIEKDPHMMALYWPLEEQVEHGRLLGMGDIG